MNDLGQRGASEAAVESYEFTKIVLQRQPAGDGGVADKYGAAVPERRAAVGGLESLYFILVALQVKLRALSCEAKEGRQKKGDRQEGLASRC